MKKTIVLGMSALVLLSGCDTYAGAGAYTGTMLGSVLGSAIGGISDGPRGSDIGTIIGMAGGAIIGSAIGTAQDQKRQEDLDQYRRDKAERAAARAARQGQSVDSYSGYQTPDTLNYDSGFDSSNSGDDRIYDFTSSEYTGDYSAQQPQTNMPMQSSVESLAGGLKYTPTLEIRNARFVDDNHDGLISRGELSKIIFEVYNTGNQVVYDVQPTVVEMTGNKHLFISPSMHVEKILPGKGIRYTALVQADSRLKDGNAKFCVSVVQGGQAISKVSEFNIPTSKL